MIRMSLLTLLALCLFLSRLAADEKMAYPAATTEQIQQTIDRSIAFLQTEGADWVKTRGCAACHHVPIPIWALSEAKRNGYSIDEKFVADTLELMFGSMDRMIAAKIFYGPNDPPDPRPQGRGLNMGLL